MVIGGKKVNALQKRRVVNGVWYEVCISQAGEIRDVIEESNLYDAEKRQKLAQQWPNGELIFVRQHRLDPNVVGASTFVIFHR